MSRLPILIAALLAFAGPCFAAGPLDELRSAFTIDGKPVPPEIFRDLGDGDLADSEPILVTVDARAAIGSNRYGDAITRRAGWIAQSHPGTDSLNGAEETGYRYIGATRNGLLVAVAFYNGGGSGSFYTLHVLDATLAQAFDGDGRPYERVDLTTIRSIALGDRWEGEVTISGDTVHIATEKTAADNAPKEIEARRP
jgi:hypothetical protein